MAASSFRRRMAPTGRTGRRSTNHSENPSGTGTTHKDEGLAPRSWIRTKVWRAGAIVALRHHRARSKTHQDRVTDARYVLGALPTCPGSQERTAFLTLAQPAHVLRVV